MKSSSTGWRSSWEKEDDFIPKGEIKTQNQEIHNSKILIHRRGAWAWAFTCTSSPPVSSGTRWRSPLAPPWSPDPRWSQARRGQCQPRIKTHTRHYICDKLEENVTCDIFFVLWEGKDGVDAYRWTVVDAFTWEEELLPMDKNSSVPGNNKKYYYASIFSLSILCTWISHIVRIFLIFFNRTMQE